MKKLISLALIVCMSVVLVGCGGADTKKSTTEKKTTETKETTKTTDPAK